MFGFFKRRREAKERLKQIAETPASKPSFQNVKRVPTRPATFSDTYRPSSSDNSSTDMLNTMATMAILDSVSSTPSYDPTPSFSGGGGDFGGGGSSSSWDSSSSSCSYDSSSSSSYDSGSSSCSSSFD